MGAKDGSFTREVCQQLSLWWTGDESQDLLVKSNSSGARATSRAKAGKNVRGHCGDVAATDETIAPLLKLVTIELKRGYGRATIAELLDAASSAKSQTYEAFLEQTILSADNAKTPYWLLIHRRDRRRSVVYFPRSLYKALTKVGSFQTMPVPFVTAFVYITPKSFWVAATPLSEFLNCVKPHHVLKLARRL